MYSKSTLEEPLSSFQGRIRRRRRRRKEGKVLSERGEKDDAILVLNINVAI